MSHRIKLRAWDAERRCFYYSTQPGVDFVFGKMGDGVYIDNLMRLDLTDENTSQFTGLKDKNGVEIFEGDIVHSHSMPDSPIEYSRGSFNAVYDDGSHDEWEAPLWRYSVEVIGNIYENPELLEVTS